MLLGDPPDRNLTASGDADRVAEHPLGFEDPLGMVAQRPVAEITVVFLGLVEPGVQADVVVDLATPFALGAQGMVVGVSDGYSPPLRVESSRASARIGTAR